MKPVILITLCIIFNVTKAQENTAKLKNVPQVNYLLTKHTFSSGGGVISNGIYKITSSIGQIDANYNATNGIYEIRGGFLRARSAITEDIFKNSFE